MRSRDEHEETKTEVQPTVDPEQPKQKSLEDRVASLETRLVPIIGPVPE